MAPLVQKLWTWILRPLMGIHILGALKIKNGLFKPYLKNHKSNTAYCVYFLWYHAITDFNQSGDEWRKSTE